MMKRLLSVVLSVLSVAFLSTFSLESGHAQEPVLTVKNPAAGDTVMSPVTVEWAVEGVTIRPAAEAASREEGHFHLFVDTPADLQAGTPIPAGNPQILHTAATSMELAGLAPGEHTITVVLGYSDHTPWQPPVTASVTFTVAGAATQAPATMPQTGALMPVSLLVLAGLLSLAGGVFLRRTA